MTYFGLALLALLLVGLYSSLRVSAQADDVMSAWQRSEILKERHEKNPDLRRFK